MAALPTLVLGFLAGLLTFRQKSRWCPHCGVTLTCPGAGQHVNNAEGGPRWTASSI